MAAAPQPPPPQPAKAKPAAETEPKSDSKAKPKPVKPRTPSPWSWGPAWRTTASLLAVLHLAAVASAPWAIQLRDLFVPNVPPGTVFRDRTGREVPPPDSIPPMVPVLPLKVAGFFWHYANLAYVNHGYDFFSPDPGVGHVIDYRIFNARNEKTAEGRLPDRRVQWPRLFYHRHMMLVDQSADPSLAGARWETRIARRLLEVHGGERIEMDFKVHHLRTPAQVNQGVKGDDPSTYELIGTIRQRRDEPLPAPAPPPGTTPRGDPSGQQPPGPQPSAVRIPGRGP